MPGNTAANHRSRTLAGVAIFLIGLAVANWPTHAQAQLPSAGVSAVPTYESVGLYWSNSGANSTGCEVKFRTAGDSAWRQGLAMWFDARDGECPGSLVGLAQNTSYEVEFNLPGQAATRGLTFSTWANQLPVARTITVASGAATLNITEGGNASGYVVYQGAPGAVLDASNSAQFNVSVNASYVIVRGLTLKGAQQDAIRISPDVKDVVIEDNDISGWGRTRDGTWGANMDSGIRAICSTETLERVTIQRNRIHDPRYSANSWSDGHPSGPQGVTFSFCGGNNVFRWNEIYSTTGNRFNDAIGGEDNFSTTGFPNKDSDIYGNIISHAWDDGIEAEGGNKNVRIWGNYIDRTGTGIATTIVSVGPVYIFRNVYSRNEFFANKPHDADDRQPFFKSGSSADFGNGRRYLLHNTMLQPDEAGSSYGLGGGAGVGGTGDTQLVHNTISMNNIYHLWKPNAAVYQVGADNVFQNDMFNGVAGTAMASGINATPAYAAGNGWQSESNGQYQLAPGTPGSQQAARIANFNDVFSGAAPDVGAYEPALGTMKFGLAAAGAAPPPAPTPTPAPAPTPTPTPAPTPTPTPGNGTTTLGIDSSSYTSAAGQSVTFTVTLSGGAGTPTGTINFRDGGTSLPGCASVAISGGVATCSSSGLAAGSHPMTALYSGNGVYGTGIAGPITQTVNPAAAAPAATLPALNVQGLWWRSVAESGWGVNLTQQGEKLFATWFTYDADGSGLWLVMSDGVKTGDNSYTGALYRTTGPAYNTATFDKSAVVDTQVGTASFSFSDASNGVFTATVNGTVVTKPITRLVYAAQVPTCKVGGSAGAAPNYQDLWWRTGGSESGWGLNITHQGDILFMTWFTYGADGKGMWLLASNVAKTGNGTYSGTLYRTWGPPFDMQPWDPARVTMMPVGSVSFAFGDASNGVFTYTVDGVTQSKEISRLAFSTPASVCR